MSTVFVVSPGAACVTVRSETLPIVHSVAVLVFVKFSTVVTVCLAVPMARSGTSPHTVAANVGDDTLSPAVRVLVRRVTNSPDCARVQERPIPPLRRLVTNRRRSKLPMRASPRTALFPEP